jgi:hypothetical protein
MAVDHRRLFGRPAACDACRFSFSGRRLVDRLGRVVEELERGGSRPERLRGDPDVVWVEGQQHQPVTL